jgi:O-antigen/teichoic acid export membrane protein
MGMYRKAYFYIGLVVLVIGMALIPFLPYLMKDTTDLINIRIVYGIYIIKNVASYWLFAYKRSLFEADQKSYITSIISYGVICLWKLLQIGMLFLLRKTPDLSFYVYCAGDMLCSMISNLVIATMADKTYPFIKEKDIQPLPAEEKKDLFKNVYGVALYKLSSTINGSADSIIISGFLGTALLGLYSNYLLIAGAIIAIVNTLFISITSSVGNLNALGTDERKAFVFDALHLTAFWINGFCFICLWNLLNPFLSALWIGSEYELEDLVVFAMCANYLVDGLMESPIRFRNACGLYWQSRYRAVATVIINVVLSILAVTVFDWGIPGVLLATIISRLIVTLWVDTYLVHKYVLHRSPTRYFFKYFCSLGLVIATGALLKAICYMMPESSVGFFFLRMLLCIIVPNLLWWLIFRNTDEFKFLLASGMKILNKIKIHVA